MAVCRCTWRLTCMKYLIKAESSGQFCQRRLVITTNEGLLWTHIKTEILNQINFARTVPQNEVISLDISFSNGVKSLLKVIDIAEITNLYQVLRITHLSIFYHSNFILSFHLYLLYFYQPIFSMHLWFSPSVLFVLLISIFLTLKF